jgi:hypothetical protein
MLSQSIITKQHSKRRCFTNFPRMFQRLDVDLNLVFNILRNVFDQLPYVSGSVSLEAHLLQGIIIKFEIVNFISFVLLYLYSKMIIFSSSPSGLTTYSITSQSDLLESPGLATL